MRRHFILAALALTALSACAPNPDSIQAAPIASSTYQGMSCEAVNARLQATRLELAPLVAQQAQSARNDANSMGWVVLCPLCAVAGAVAGGGADNSGRIASLRGEEQTLSIIANGCG